ncbi:hypothetical protein [Vibrio metschnikovii]|uniref:hypothetical protein n=1 Tax=Vibrio metschnikovii TaxID=28172 RepID=UPI002FC9438B
MGGRSSSSSSTTNNNTSGQTGIEGDNLGVALSGIANSELNISSTDHGAVNAALAMGGEMIGEMGKLSNNAIVMADNVAEKSMDFSANAMSQGFELAGELVHLNAAFANQALAGNAQLADRAMANNANFANQALAGNAQLADRAMANTANFANEVLAGNAQFADRMVDRYAHDSDASRQMLAGFAGNQAEQNTKNLNAMIDLAKHKQDGGASVQSKQQLIAFVAIFIVVGFVVVRGK